MTYNWLKSFMNRRNYIIKSRLKKERYWTERLIDKYLGYSDFTTKNPNHPYDPFARPCLYYSLRRIRKIERTVEFKIDFEKRMRRLK